MKFSVNSVTIVGKLGRDPEVKYLQSGTAVAEFSVATEDSYKDKTTGEWKKNTEWHNIVVYGKNAEFVKEKLSKGSTVLVEGSLATDSWEDKKTGEKKYKTRVKANDFVPLDGKAKAAASYTSDEEIPF